MKVGTGRKATLDEIFTVIGDKSNVRGHGKDVNCELLVVRHVLMDVRVHSNGIHGESTTCVIHHVFSNELECQFFDYTNLALLIWGLKKQKAILSIVHIQKRKRFDRYDKIIAGNKGHVALKNYEKSLRRIIIFFVGLTVTVVIQFLNAFIQCVELTLISIRACYMMHQGLTFIWWTIVKRQRCACFKFRHFRNWSSK